MPAGKVQHALWVRLAVLHLLPCPVPNHLGKLFTLPILRPVVEAQTLPRFRPTRFRTALSRVIPIRTLPIPFRLFAFTHSRSPQDDSSFATQYTCPPTFVPEPNPTFACHSHLSLVVSCPVTEKPSPSLPPPHPCRAEALAKAGPLRRFCLFDFRVWSFDWRGPHDHSGQFESHALAQATPTESDTTRAHTYTANTVLSDAICIGARGACWDILRGLRGTSK